MNETQLNLIGQAREFGARVARDVDETCAVIAAWDGQLPEGMPSPGMVANVMLWPVRIGTNQGAAIKVVITDEGCVVGDLAGVVVPKTAASLSEALALAHQLATALGGYLGEKEGGS